MNRQLVTIVTEAALERRLIEEVKRLGAKGYTIVKASGEGARGVREAAWEHSKNIRMETICRPEVADAIMEHLSSKYYEHYAMVAWTTDVEVLRPDKF
ncbi:MAG: transcriptional regulator [Gemmatimonadales bacterium]|jgi:nitrogen regulatory protein P-II 2|nr:MAG: transcriptional regulator [Gemmatimonadales bacterium]